MVAVNVGMPAFPSRASHNVRHLRDTRGFAAAAHEEPRNTRMRENIDHVTHLIRKKRAHIVVEKSDWEQLRLTDSHIKRDIITRLPELPEQFKKSVTDAGGRIRWAHDAVEANRTITSLVKETGEEKVVKVKSMATQEIGLNGALVDADTTAHKTGLAELIVQLADDMLSHVLIPAVHRNHEDIREIFLNGISGVDPGLETNPAELAGAFRRLLREQFAETKVAISDANFGVAETGTMTVVESRDNGRVCLTLPETLISVMGIEKSFPTLQDSGVFLQLLP